MAVSLPPSPMTAAHAALLVIASLLAGCNSAQPPTDAPIAGQAGLRILAIDLDKMEAANASGFFVAPNLVVTCNHVVTKRMPLGVVCLDGTRGVIEKIVSSDP